MIAFKLVMLAITAVLIVGGLITISKSSKEEISGSIIITILFIIYIIYIAMS